MSNKYRTDDVDLSNNFSIIAHPLHVSQTGQDGDVDDEETNDDHWLAKSRKLQARRWRKLKYQQV